MCGAEARIAAEIRSGAALSPPVTALCHVPTRPDETGSQRLLGLLSGGRARWASSLPSLSWACRTSRALPRAWELSSPGTRGLSPLPGAGRKPERARTGRLGGWLLMRQAQQWACRGRELPSAAPSAEPSAERRAPSAERRAPRPSDSPRSFRVTGSRALAGREVPLKVPPASAASR